jgi:hypothetical protein
MRYLTVDEVLALHERIIDISGEARVFGTPLDLNRRSLSRR